ncbi:MULTISPECIES: hypothetical protein [Mesorhizobium]|nr:MULTISPECIES: hypothetical protein [Mesorhizobium]
MKNTRNDIGQRDPPPIALIGLNPALTADLLSARFLKFIEKPDIS